jgi:hypothetical protein
VRRSKGRCQQVGKLRRRLFVGQVGEGARGLTVGCSCISVGRRGMLWCIRSPRYGAFDHRIRVEVGEKAAVCIPRRRGRTHRGREGGRPSGAFGIALGSWG